MIGRRTWGAHLPPAAGVDRRNATVALLCPTMRRGVRSDPRGYVDPLPPRGVALHAARVGGGLAAHPVLGGGGEAAFRPVGANLHLVAAALQLLHGRCGQAAFYHQHAGAGGARPERQREVLDVPGRRVDGLLQVHLGGGAAEAGVAKEELAAPLVLLVAAWGAPAHVRGALAQGHADRKRGARAL